MNIKHFPQSPTLSQSHVRHPQQSQAHLRQSLKLKWLQYYREHRDWLVKLGIWVSCEGERRPSSSFILATLSILEPRLPQIMPIVVELNSNPDRIVKALGLNFSPDAELEKAIASGLLSGEQDSIDDSEMKLLTGSMMEDSKMPQATVQDSVDLYLEHEHSINHDHPIEHEPIEHELEQVDVEPVLGDGRSPHKVASQQDAQCSGMGGYDPFQTIRNVDIRI